jgi:hypothetical protein
MRRTQVAITGGGRPASFSPHLLHPHNIHAHDGSWIAWQVSAPFLIDTKTHTGRPVSFHGQTAITEELYRVRECGGREVEK